MNYAQIKMRLANKGKGSFRSEGSTIFLYDAIASNQDEADFWGGVSPEAFIAQLDSMSGPVTLRINSPGGSVFGAQAMVAAMRQYNGPITAQVDSLAASAASVLAVSCASCTMVPGAMMMIHKAWGVSVGNSTDMNEMAALLDKLDGSIAATYAEKAGGSVDDFLAKMAAETWLTADEAVAAKLADQVAQNNTQRAQMNWDLSAFAAAPTSVAEVAAVPTPPVEPAPANNAEMERDARLRHADALIRTSPI